MDQEIISSKEAFKKAAIICSKAEKCSPDIRKKIVSWGLEKYDAEAVVDKLKEEKYIDDGRYCKAYFREKFRINKWGKIKIAYYLKQKGISDKYIEIGKEEIDQDKYVEALLKIMKDKAKSIKSNNRFDKMGKIIRFAQTRGFEAELIHRHMNSIL